MDELGWLALPARGTCPNTTGRPAVPMRSASWSSSWPDRTHGGGTGASRVNSWAWAPHRRGRIRRILPQPVSARPTPGITHFAADPDVPGVRDPDLRLPGRL